MCGELCEATWTFCCLIGSCICGILRYFRKCLCGKQLNHEINIRFYEVLDDDQKMEKLKSSLEELLIDKTSEGNPQETKPLVEVNEDIDILAYLVEERNAEKYAELEKDKDASMIVLLLNDERNPPDIPLSRTHIRVAYNNRMETRFYDRFSKVAWEQKLHKTSNH